MLFIFNVQSAVFCGLAGFVALISRFVFLLLCECPFSLKIKI